MLDGINLPAGLSPALRAACDSLTTSVTLADPSLDDMPLVYANRAFEELTLYPVQEVIGQNCRFLQGRVSDRTVSDEIASVCQNHGSDSFCVINYRRNGTLFFNLLSIGPVQIAPGRTLLMGCQSAFRPTQNCGTLARTAAAIDHAHRQLRLGRRVGPTRVNMHDTFRLDATAMRFDATFTRVRNLVIRNTNDRMQAARMQVRERAFA
ncbi:PAS domain-containing protein [uncultured Roseobacter sp.]|uniref:PAS domain-containing protein n=1 Tax=uncultured Roseobacter sp. TaxID=114847 RepID=UPI00260229D0|nr:PAS domain-containing protein [uncultured Roseobacter sp.]